MLRWMGSGRLFIIILSVFLAHTLVSCQDDAMGIGKGILPGTDDFALFHDESLGVHASTTVSEPLRVNPEKPSSVYASVPNYFLHAFGWFSDPVFGKVSADVGFPFLMENVGENFGEGATVDSLVLFLKYQTKKGSSDHPVGFELYELSEGMNDTLDYYSDFSFNGKYHSAPIAEGLFNPAVSDSFLSIRITDADLISKLISLDSVDMVSDSTFWTHFKGFYMKPVPLSGNGQMYYLSFFISEMDMFYHNDAADSLFFRYLCYPYASVSSISHDYSGSFVGSVISEGLSNDFLFLGASVGPVASFRFPDPGLKDWFDQITENQQKVVAFNKVELDLFSASGQNVKDIPKSLYLMNKNEEGSYSSIDYLIPATYNKDKGCYTFDITVFIQDHIKSYYAGELTYPDLVLVAGENTYTPYQVIIDNRKTKIRTIFSQSQ